MSDPIILPIIKNVMPNLIANAIVGVQPMSSPYSKEDGPYQVDVLEFGKYTDIIPMRQWCRETLNEGEWVAIAQYFAFKTEEALAWFKLRWL